MSAGTGARSPVGDGDGGDRGDRGDRRDRGERGGRGGATPTVMDRAQPRSYYGRPVIKEPVWKPEIAVYFFTGGLAGAAAPLALAAQLRGELRLARVAWLTALAGVSVSPVLLIKDLGRPERFFNMLRMVKVTSPMSVGTWILSAAGPAIGLAAARSTLGRFDRSGRVAGWAAAGLGPALSTYTAVLVANTAIPVWHEARRELPFVFAAGSASSAGAVVAALAPRDESAPARRLALAGAVAEVVAVMAMERRLGELGEPYHEGEAGRSSRAALGLTVAGAATMALGGRRRVTTVLGGAMITAGAMFERWAVYRAGFAGARDPKYVVGPQRRRVAEREAAGA